MEYAKRIEVSDGSTQPTGIVSINIILQKEDATQIQTCKYVCPDERCGVPVRPVIPVEEKAGRKKSPRAYFRASRSQGHTEECQAEGVSKPGGQGSAWHPEEDPTGQERNRQAKFVTRYSERVANTRTPNTQPHDAKAGFAQPDQGPYGNGGRVMSTGDNTSTSTSSLVRRLVEDYENPTMDPATIPLLGVPDCPGRTYATVFRSAARGVTKTGQAVGQYIFYGEIERFDDYPSGTWIGFKDRSLDHRPLGVWISTNLGPSTVMDELKNRLLGKPHRLYALGLFEPVHHGKKYSIEIPRLGRIWISLVGENQ